MTGVQTCLLQCCSPAYLPPQGISICGDGGYIILFHFLVIIIPKELLFCWKFVLKCRYFLYQRIYFKAIIIQDLTHFMSFVWLRRRKTFQCNLKCHNLDISSFSRTWDIRAWKTWQNCNILKIKINMTWVTLFPNKNHRKEHVEKIPGAS